MTDKERIAEKIWNIVTGYGHIWNEPTKEECIKKIEKKISERIAELEMENEGIKESSIRIMTQGCQKHNGRPILMEELGRCPICDFSTIEQLQKENSELKEKIERAISTLEFCLNKEVFPQGVCEADKETEAYTRAKQTLSELRDNK